MSAKAKRQSLIKELLNTKIISSQEELARLLAKKDIQATQATLSRDFAELGVVRVVTENGIRYIFNSDEAGKQISKLISYEIISIESNESLIVLRTLAGRAQGVAHYIDRLNKQEILGTVGGDDTVLIIPDRTKNIPSIIRLIKNLMIRYQY
ncbi:Arginine pathway regulatory protein ArgR, repressor of arg regulon [hydrothermal vent metagenome]|uniref:Arginine pathway regulatory protein ArgR, repressor of arg regulon n=1 Tax=hydrothermal vent metagenome TaxID=652676 RepID=A0A3B1DIN7_9ZZZZ